MFSPSWFERYHWIHYDENRDAAFCFVCVKALENPSLSSKYIFDSTFTTTGFRNWSKALQEKKGFKLHEKSDVHVEVVARYINAPSCEFVAEMHHKNIANEKEVNRPMLLKILSNIRYLAQQALPLRGDWNDETGSEENSNFNQLLLLQSEDDKEILRWIRRARFKYTSPEIQNEMLEVLALRMLSQVAANIRNTEMYTIMADETADISNNEQLVICIINIKKFTTC